MGNLPLGRGKTVYITPSPYPVLSGLDTVVVVPSPSLYIKSHLFSESNGFVRMKTHMEPTLPVLPRLDRLDRLLELLEEKHSKSTRFGSTKVDDDHNYNDDGDYKERKGDHMNCRTLLSALDDVHHKGTLIDRLGMLENRVLQLSMDMEEGSISRSSSSTAYATKEDKELPTETRSLKSSGKRKRRRVHFKWIGWFAMRC